LVSMDDERRELRWVASGEGIFFMSDDDSGVVYEDRKPARIPVSATEVRAVLPNGETRIPVLEGNGLVFWPPLPKRSQVFVRGRLLFTVDD
jgi:hypothetical protein